jgi:hypothetical protein
MNFIPRNAGDPKQTRQAMLEQKLRRLNELNNNLRHELQRERIPVSQAARRYAFAYSPPLPDVHRTNPAQHHCLHRFDV